VGALITAGYGSVLGSFFPVMTVMSASDIGGGLSVAADPAALVSTFYNIGNIAGILVTPAFAARVGRGRSMAWAGMGFLLASIAAAIAPTLPWMLAARLFHGLFGGALPLMFMLLVMTSLKPGSGRFEGMTAFAASTTVFFGLAAPLGGSLADGFGWRALFWVQAIAILPYCLAARHVLTSELGNPSAFKTADWGSYTLITLGLSAILFAMSEGERHFWTETWWVPALLVGGSIAAGFARWTLANAPRPLLVLAVFDRATFRWAMVLTLFFRFGSLFAIFIVPQYLGRIQGYRPIEVGALLAVMMPATLVAVVLAYYLSRRFDGRLVLTAGLSCYALASWLCTDISPEWAADQLRYPAIVAGLGMGFFQVAVLRYAVLGANLQNGPTVGAMFNLARVFGIFGGLAILSHLLVEREKFHSARIVEGLAATDPETAGRLAVLAGNFARFSSDDGGAHHAATASLTRAAGQQAFTLGFADVFTITALALLLGAILVWILPALAPEASPAPAPSTTHPE
jgi:MFS family permease